MSQAEIKPMPAGPGVLSWSPILIGHRLQLPKARTNLVWDYQSTTRVFLKIPSLCLLLEVFSGGRGGGHLKPFTTNLAQKFLRVHLKLNFWSDEQNRLKNNLTWGSVFLKCFFLEKRVINSLKRLAPSLWVKSNRRRTTNAQLADSKMVSPGFYPFFGYFVPGSSSIAGTIFF